MKMKKTTTAALAFAALHLASAQAEEMSLAGEWNLEQEDTLIVRELPEHFDSTTGYLINGYDFSLASGQSEFLTEVVVTVPRASQDDYDSMFVTKNKETGKYEYSYFEISDDGANYLIYTTHFSEQDQITHKAFAEAVTFLFSLK